MSDLKRVIKRGLPIRLMDDVILLLREQKVLEPKYKDHELSGEYSGFRECHIQPDWLLIYRVENDNLILVAARTGTHSDLF
jgi:mRNA interferase YafQ